MRFRSPCALAAPLRTTALILTLAGSTALADETIVRGSDGRALDEYMTRLAGVGFAGAVVVAKDGSIVLQKGYGLADRETGRPVTPDTVYTTGSITKQFTAAGIMKLYMRGLLDVDDPITTFFDGVPEDKRSITVHHLLTHTAGFPGAIGGDFDASATGPRMIELAMGTPLHAPPGERYEYSNVGYSLLGLIIERVSGQPYERFLRDELFAPAGMTKTGYVLPGYAPEERAVGYTSERWGTFADRAMTADGGPSWHLRANGGIHSTVGDMYRWHRALQGETVLSTEAKQLMFKPHVDEGGGGSHYGYGWAIFTSPWDTKLIAHNGGNGIFSADFRNYVDDDLMIYASTGLARFAPVDLITESLAEIAMGHDVPMPPATTTMDAASAARCTGTYELDGGGALIVEAERDRLVLSPRGAAARALLAGQLPPDDPSAKAASERTLEVARSWFEGDLTPLVEVWGGRMSPEQVREALGNLRGMREERLGAFESVEVAGCRQEGDEIVVETRFRHARGAAPMELMWRDDALVGVMLRGGGGPRPQSDALELFPADAGRYTSWDPRTGRSVVVRFEFPPQGEADAVRLEQGPREIVARRAR